MMWRRLKTWLAPPVFEDGQKMRAAQLLNVVCLGLFITLVPLTIFSLYLFTQPDPRTFLVSLMTGSVTLSFLFMRTGRVKTASILLITALWLGFSVGMAFASGIITPALGINLIVTLLAGLLLGIRAGLFMAGLTIVSGFVLYWLQAGAIIERSQEYLPLEGALVLNIAFVIFTAVLVYLYTTLLNNTLLISQQNEHKLLQSNRELQELRDTLEAQVIIRTQQLRLLIEINNKLGSILDFEQLIVELIEQIDHRFDYYHAHVYLLDDNREDLVLVAGIGEAGAKMKANGHHVPFHAPISLVARAARTKEVVWVNNVRQTKDWLPNALLPNTYAEMAVPIMVENRTVGVLDVQQDTIAGLDEGDAELLRSLANQMGIAINNARLYELSQQSNQELSRLNADKDRFFSIVAHDLKGPFQPVLGNAELLVEMADQLSADEVKNISQSIMRSGRQVIGLLENLLQWARMQMGRMSVQPETVRLADIAEQTVDLLQSTADKKQIILSQVIPAEMTVYSDGNMCDTIIRNLTNNALKFTLNVGRVTISARQDGEFVEISVTDTGVGMSAEAQAKLFQIGVHHTTAGTENESGTGLGLIMCQEMVQLNGGRIWVESEDGRGSTFRFTLPVSRGILR